MQPLPTTRCPSSDAFPDCADQSGSAETQLRQAVAELEQQLIRMQRLAALGTMSAMIVHEFNNLMAPLLPRAEFALGTGEPADMRKALERTKSQVQRAIAVSERLLKLADGAEPPTAPCHLADVVAEAVAAVVRPFEKDGIDLTISIAEGLSVRAQRDLLVQALLNLLLNARAAMKGVRGSLGISARSEGRFAVIEVRDSGIGIDRRLLENVINPFLAGGDLVTGGGTHVGLGLRVCRLIAERHGAALQGRLNDTRGCTFRLCWPVA